MAITPTGRVTGGLYAPDGAQVVTGTVIFTPDAPMYPEGADGPTIDAATSYDLVDGKLPSAVELAAVGGVTYEVKFRNLRAGKAAVSIPLFHMSLRPGETVRLIDVMPVIPNRGTVIVVDTTAAIRAEVAAASAESSAVSALSSAERAELAAAGVGLPGGSGPGVDAVARQAAAEAQRAADGAASEAALAHDTADDASRVAADAANTAAAAYKLPSTGVPAGAMSEDVRASLGRADSALQSAPVTTVAGKAGAVTLVKGDVGLSQVDNTSDAAKPVSTATQAALAGKADLVGGVIPSSQIPAVALLDPVVVASQAAMLALTSAQVQRGDVAIRTDGAGTFVLNAADPSVLTNWLRINSPTDAVTSVNGQTGTVALAKDDIGLGNVSNTAPADLPVSTSTQQALDGKAASTHGHAASQITDSTATGRNLLTAADGAAARSAIGAGTSSLGLGSTSSTAKRGDYAPTAADISDGTSTGRALVTATDAAAARNAIGAGTSSLGLGATSTTAKRGDYAPAAADISDATSVGRGVLTATSPAAGRSALGITGTGADGSTGATGPQGAAGNVRLLAAGATAAPTDAPAGTIIAYRA